MPASLSTYDYDCGQIVKKACPRNHLSVVTVVALFNQVAEFVPEFVLSFAQARLSLWIRLLANMFAKSTILMPATSLPDFRVRTPLHLALVGRDDGVTDR